MWKMWGMWGEGSEDWVGVATGKLFVLICINRVARPLLTLLALPQQRGWGRANNAVGDRPIMRLGMGQ